MAILNWRDHPRLRFVDFPPASVNKGAIFIAFDREDTAWTSNGTEWVEVNASSRHLVTSSTLISAYEAEQKVTRVHGSRVWPRAALISADDVPTISSVSDPITDPDSATQVLYPFGIAHTTTVPKEYRTTDLLRGHNPNLNTIRSGRHYLVPSKLKITGADGGDAGSDSVIEAKQVWGLGTSPKYCSFTLDDDVFYLPSSLGGADTQMHLMVGESIVTPTISGANLSVGAAGFNFYSAAVSHYIKFKFPTIARRRVTLVFEAAYIPESILTRITATLTFRTTPRLRWLAFGDSFTDSTISDASTVRAVTHTYGNVMHAAFGGEFDFINLGVGGAGFALSDTSIFLGDIPPYINWKLPSFRKQLVTATQGLDADVITILCGHNDNLTYNSALFTKELEGFITDARSMHKNSLIFVLGANTSPNIMNSGADIGTENKIAEVCASLGVTHIPLQTRTPSFLRGNGKQSAPTSNGNCDRMVGPDGYHPTIAGHNNLGQLLAEEIYSILVRRAGVLVP